MKIIEPSATIIEDELAALPIHQRIDTCGAICYQRPAKPTEEEAIEFCKSMLTNKHLTTLEMVRIHLVVDGDHDDEFSFGKYIDVKCIDIGRFIISGSIRAFLEKWDNLDAEIRRFLKKNYPQLFIKQYASRECWGMRVRFADPEEIPREHKYVAVKVICSRAISHQIVRHRPVSFLQESQRYCRYDDEVVFIRPEWVANPFSWDNSAVIRWVAHMETCEAYYKHQLQYGKLSPQQARGGLPNDTKTELLVYASLPEWEHIFNLRCSKGADPEVRRIMIPLQEQFVEKYGE